LTATIPTAGIVYIYDELQRLKSVIDPVGEAATYGYDAVGNLLSIARNTSSQTSIIDFNPNNGPIGNTVSIYGTGYSATPSQNSVTFNGVAATVISSTLTQIVTTVPAGASNGPIAVTSPAGSANSSTNFSVTGGAAGVPSIANFSPPIGSIGGTLTINGTNFDTTAANNEVRINGALVFPTTATPTSLTLTIPSNASSGKISVSTASGTALSSQIFFVPPSPNTATNLEPPVEASIGGASFTTTIATAGKIAMAVFYGTSGQEVELGMNATDLGTVGNEATYHIYGPGGIDLIARGTWNVNPKFTLPTTGYYTLAFDPAGSLTGYATWTLSEPVNGGIVVVDGASATGSTTRVGQTVRFTFEGSASQFASLGVVTSGGMGGGDLIIFRPDGIAFYSSDFVGTGTNPHMTLPMTGTYKIMADPDGTAVGGITLNLSSEAYGGEMSIDGAVGAVNISRYGQRGRITFNNAVANRIVSFAPVTFADTNTFYSIQGPSGNFIVNEYFLTNNTNHHMYLQNTGIHTILLDPGGTGNFTVILSTEVNGGAIAINGAAVPLSTTRIGQRAKLTFSGVTGQLVTVHFTNNTAGWFYPALVKPDGTTLVSDFTQAINYNLPQQTLPQDGIYTIYFDPTYDTTGGVTINVTSP
jgi:YD repeat-containing protein